MYDKIKLESILTDQNFRAVNDVGRPFIPSHEVYEKISDEMRNQGSTISKKHVYQILKSNRGGMLDILLTKFNIVKETSNFEKLSSSDTKYTPTKNNVASSSEDAEFKVVISNEVWADLKTKVKYDYRKYTVLKQKKWTNIFAQKIYEQTHIECVFSFKRAKIYKRKDLKCYSSFDGKCVECGGILSGQLFLKPGKKEDTIFNCKLKNAPHDFHHTKKRQLRGDLRSQVAGELLDAKKSAAEWRREQAATIPFGKSVPPTLPDLATLRKAKQEELDDRLQLKTDNPVENLLIAKFDILPRTIKSIGLHPFYCYYWSDLQELLYKNERKENWNCEMCIDATSSLANKLNLPNGKKSPSVFLYSCVINSKNITFPAFHMLTTKQDAVRIINFLMEIKKRVKPPRTVVSDFGEAILIAVAHVFAECANLLDYLSRCYQIIKDEGSPLLPTTFIRLDISHFVQTVCSWPCFKNRLPTAKDFTVKSLCYIYKCDNFTEVEAAMRDLLTVLMSKDIGFCKESLKKLKSQNSLEKADERIRGESIERCFKKSTEEFDKDESHCDETYIEDEFDSEEENNSSNSKQSLDEENVGSGGNLTPWKTWADELWEIAEKRASASENGIVVSAFFNMSAATKIKKKLMCNLPLWTGIMRPFFKRGEEVATSAPVESEFSALKSRFKRQMRVDKFAILHIDYLDEKVKLAAAESVKVPKKATEDKRQEKSLIDLTTLKQTEIVNVSSLVENQLSDILLTEPDPTTAVELCSFAESLDSHHKFSPRKTSTPINMNLRTNNNILMECNSMKEKENRTGNVNKSEMPLLSNDDSISMEYNSLNENENWRGKGKENEVPPQRSGRKRKTKYLSPTPTWDSTNRITPKGIPILQNGNLCEPLYMTKKNVIVLQTCAFDSLVHIVTNSIAIYDGYKLISKDVTIPIFHIAHKILKKGKITNEIYKDRANILLDIANQDSYIFKYSQTRKVRTIDAKCNAAHLAEILFKEMPTYKTLYECRNSECLFSSNINYLTLAINVDVILLNGMECLQKAVDDIQNQNKLYSCQKCGTPNKVKNQYGRNIIIDTSLITHTTYIDRLKENLKLLKKTSKNRRSSELQGIYDSATFNKNSEDLNNRKISTEFLLESIPLSISVNDKIYRIGGIVSYSSQGEHYKSYLWQNKWYEYDDMSSSKRLPIKNEKICPHVLFYVR